MSILVYKDKTTASTAAATLVAAQLIGDPASVLGLDFDDALLPLYGSLGAMTANGLVDWRLVRLVQLFEYVKNDAVKPNMDAMRDAFLKDTNFEAAHLVRPDSESTNWAISCQGFEDRILKLGGMDMAVLHLRDDGSFLYNAAHSDVVPVTHVELSEGCKVVTAGVTTVMSAKRLVVLATGKDSSSTVAAALKGAINEAIPASLLQLHQNAVFVLDDDAASLL